jgi:hypothetical protein
LKSKFIILLFLLYHLTSAGQTFQLKIIGTTIIENHTIDSIGYLSSHQNTKQLLEEINSVSKNLSKIGYINNQILEKKKTNDTNYTAKISLGQRTKNIHIYIGIKNTQNLPYLFDKKNDSIVLPYPQIEPFLKHTLQILEQNGYAFAKVKLTNIQKRKQTLFADLTISLNSKRNLNAIEIKYPNQIQKKIFPKGAEKQINKKYKNTIFNQETIKQLYDDFQKFGFINQIKYPEILFTKDTTKAFIYLEKRRANNFDGYLGFNTAENKKVSFNGYLNLTLINTLKNGEEISIYWKNDGNSQKLFNANLEIPYLFNSAIGVKSQINIFKQDSIYQNTKTAIQIGYSIDYNRRVYLGFESTESSDIQNTNSLNLNDFKNKFYTITVDLRKNNTSSSIFPIKSYFNLTIGTGNRTIETNSSLKQNFANFNTMNNFNINEKNIINVKFQGYYLKSKTYLTNELFRFGGNNSIRGFGENSLQANTMFSIMTEYRYLISPNLYLHSILDYCYYEDSTAISEEIKNKNLLGGGIGFGLLTSKGLMKFSITNGKTKKEEIKFYNTNINISYNVKF